MNDTTFIWVVGSPRSGTTFLTDLIGRNCDYVFNEPGDDPRLRRGAVEEWVFPKAKTICFKWCENYRVADKIIARFPNSYFIHIIRGRNNNAYSMAFPKETAFPPRDFADFGTSEDERLNKAMRTWVVYNEGCLALKKTLGERYLPVFYEQLTEHYDDIEDLTGISLIERPDFHCQNLPPDDLQRLTPLWGKIPGANSLIDAIVNLRDQDRRLRELAIHPRHGCSHLGQAIPTSPAESLEWVKENITIQQQRRRQLTSSEFPPTSIHHPSQYGGLWIDYSDAPDVIEGKRALNWISQEEADKLHFLHHNGYVVLPGAASDEQMNAVTEAINTAWENKRHSCKASFYRGHDKFYELAAPEYKTEREAKLLDFHMVSESARNIIFSDPLRRYLELIFESPAVAFQSLEFEKGSQQGIHSDIAFVRVDAPRQFAASWIALEDVVDGSGELEYYPGSQKLPDYPFVSGSVWADPSISHYTKNLHAIAEFAGLEKERFMAKRGDILIWTAGLYHGGAPLTDPNSTRRSLVTHYCPLGRVPPYMVGRDDSDVVEVSQGGYVCGEYTRAVTDLNAPLE